jgi:nucleoside-diphosphate-sugar epimerase
MDNKKYLVTGGAGFIGSAVTKKLVSLGHEVRVLDDMSRGNYDRLRGLPVATVSGDIRDENTVLAAMQGMDSVIHLAYLQGTQTFYAEPRQVLDVAMRGMLNVLFACEQTGTGELLLVSSSEAYQVASVVPTPETIPLTVPDVLNPRYSYGGGKIACEIMSLAWARTGVLDRLIIARPHNIYGPDMGREHVIPEFAIRMKSILKNRIYGDSDIIRFPIQGTGQETRSFCYIDDCVDQFMLLLEKADPMGVYHVGTMDERTILDVAHGVADCYDREIKVIPGKLPQGSPPRRLPDMEKMRQLGHYYYPEVQFADGLKKTVEWYKANG